MLYTVSNLPNWRIISRLLTICFPDCETILDATYGNGNFWTSTSKHANKVIGMDKDPERARDVCADFESLPFISDSFDVAVFDPPYLTNVSVSNPGVMGVRFGSYSSIEQLQVSIERAISELVDVTKLGLIIKVQDYVHSNRVQWMPFWVYQQLGEPYDWCIQTRNGKITAPNWNKQLSVYRNHSIYMVYRWNNQRHLHRG